MQSFTGDSIGVIKSPNRRTIRCVRRCLLFGCTSQPSHSVKSECVHSQSRELIEPVQTDSFALSNHMSHQLITFISYYMGEILFLKGWGAVIAGYCDFIVRQKIIWYSSQVIVDSWDFASEGWALIGKRLGTGSVVVVLVLVTQKFASYSDSHLPGNLFIDQIDISLKIAVLHFWLTDDWEQIWREGDYDVNLSE